MKVFYIVACALFILAIACETIAMNAAARGSQTLAAAIARGQEVDDETRQESQRYASRSESLSLVGVILAFLGLASWVYSYARGYRWMPLIPVVLLIIYAAVFLIVV